jgi:hypothetical protein
LLSIKKNKNKVAVYKNIISNRDVCNGKAKYAYSLISYAGFISAEDTDEVF